MTQYEIHKMMKGLPSQRHRRTRLEDIVTAIMLVVVFYVCCIF